MSKQTNNEPKNDYIVSTTYRVSLAALLVLPPFTINHIIKGELLLSIVSSWVTVSVALLAWETRRGLYRPILIYTGILPAIIFFMIVSFPIQGLIPAFWVYPVILSFYFMLYERQAWIANVVLMLVAIPNVWMYIESDLAARLTATYIATNFFTAVIVRVINTQQQKLIVKEKQRREGMANVSHELRTPIANLMAEVEAMRDGIRPRDDEQLGLISKSVDHLHQLMEDLYQLALADVGELRFDKNELAWDEIIIEAIAFNRGSMKPRAINIESDITPGVIVRGDQQRLRQIMNNLMENCRRYTNNNATVWVVLKKQGKWATLTIEDSGPGVSQEKMRTLFDRFYRVDESRSREKGGAGLGLSLVKALTEAHEGKVEAYASKHGGLGIKIQLPLLQTE